MFKFVKYMSAVALIATTSLGAQDIALAGGGFSSSCPEISDVWQLGGKFRLTAFCYDKNHNRVPTEVSLDEHIANDDGNLVWRRNGGFTASVVGKDCSLLLTPDRSQLVLSCLVYRKNGIITLSHINLDDEIANYDGHLTVLNGF